MSSIYFTDESIGWAGGSMGTILKTSDGGRSWFEQTSQLSGNGFQGDLFSLYFINAVEGWGSVTQGKCLKQQMEV